MKHSTSSSSTLTSKGGGGSSARYKTENHHDRNKTRDGLKLIKGLEQRKAWRIKKYSATPISELSRTTFELFKKWGIISLETPRVKKQVKPVVHKRWGRKQ
jgi:hypothetical protein